MAGDWKAKSPCPQCGGDVDLEVGDHLLNCQWCRTSLYIDTHGPMSYRIDPAPEFAEDETLFYLPYWRLRGLRFGVYSEPSEPEVIGRLVDMTAPATRYLPIKANLGIRPQAAPLTLSLSEPRTLVPDLTPERIADENVATVMPVDAPGLMFSEMIGEGRVILHAPFFMERTPEGGLLREAFPDGYDHLLDIETADALEAQLARNETPPPPDFLSLQCHHCGHDLPAESRAEVLVCGHCGEAWWVNKGKFHRMPYKVLGEWDDHHRLFPFWQIIFTAPDAGLTTRADLVHWATPYRHPPDAWKEEPCSLLVPGFKLAPRTFLRVAKAATILVNEQEQWVKPRGGLLETEPVRLELKEAAEAIKLVICQMTMGKRKRFPLIEKAEMEMTGARLVFVPFENKGREWYHEASGQAIPLTSVEMGSNL